MYKINSTYIYIEMLHIKHVLIENRYVRISDITLKNVLCQRAVGAFFYETANGFPFGEMIRFRLSSFMALSIDEKDL